MCDLNSFNLIDLTFDDEASSSNTQSKTKFGSELLTNVAPIMPPSWNIRDCVENNPFDSVQNLANRLDDPFDVVEKEAELKAKRSPKNLSKVKLGNLLSLSNDNLLGGEQIVPSSAHTDINTTEMEGIDSRSTPTAFNGNKNRSGSISGSNTDSSPNSGAENNASAKLKKNMEYRKRLLKLSISNATFSSPTVCKQSKELADVFGTPVSSVLSSAAEFGENLLSAESPLKWIEDEDFISDEHLSFKDLEKKFDADLEMLKIPILNELPSPVTDQSSSKTEEHIPDLVNNQSNTLENALPNLEDIKARLKSKKEEINNNHQQEISLLIQNLKTLISSGEIAEKNKKQQANELLESLNSVLKQSDLDRNLNSSDMLVAPPIPIVRQGTFDMDLKEKQENDEDNKKIVEVMPSCMISSSATYDGESSDENKDLNLPDISLIPPSKALPLNYCPNNMQSDISDVVEQLSKLLINNSADNPTNTNNPTFIVVMNSNHVNNSNSNNPQLNADDTKFRSSFVANYVEYSKNDGSPEINPLPRRRSQSLSSHDKIKIIQLPLNTPTQKHIDETPPTITPPSSEKDIPEFKTPARLRRYSYSSGTPYTTQVGMRRTEFSSETKNIKQMRRTQALITHHEIQQHDIVRPLSNNLPTFKPDLKKKAKHNSESIIKAGPLKATIPVKKVAPMLKASPPTPEGNTKLKMPAEPRTPIPAKGISNLGVGVGFPNASSTPTAFTSPLKRTTKTVSKPRYSYMPATTNPKSLLNTSNTTRRRTITELKTKSPLKPVIANSSIHSAVASSSRVITGNSKLSVSVGARTSKSSIKNNTNTATIKPTSHVGSRFSVGGSLLTTRNKENKRP